MPRQSGYQVGYRHRGGRDTDVAAEVGMSRARGDSDDKLAIGVKVAMMLTWELRQACHVSEVVEVGTPCAGGG